MCIEFAEGGPLLGKLADPLLLEQIGERPQKQLIKSSRARIFESTIVFRQLYIVLEGQ